VTTLLLYPQLAQRLDLEVQDGALVAEVENGSPADRAGLEAGSRRVSFQGQEDVPASGDVIVSVNGERLTRSEDLADLISMLPAGKEVELEVLREGDRRTVKVKLGQRPSQQTDR
jgi:serine protease Do